MEYQKLKATCELWLREGRGELVGRALRNIKLRGIPRAERLPLAHLARRASLITLGLKILSPVMYTEQNLPVATRVPPSHGEWAEYGVLLQRLGLADEALRALRNAVGTPEASLYMAFCHFNRWELESALPHLHDYIGFQNLTAYQRFVGWVNVIAALTTLKRNSEAHTLLEEWLPLARSEGFDRLTANLLEQRAQLDLHECDFAGARAALKEAGLLLKESHTYDRLFIDKWGAAIELAEKGDESLLLAVKNRAEKNLDWETTRSCDLLRVRYKGSQHLFDTLYLGSPFPEFRRRVHMETQQRFEIPRNLLIGSGPQTMNLETGDVDGKHIFGKGRVQHKLLKALYSDFYRPLTVIGLYAAINPLEHINIYCAPSLIYQHLHHLRLNLEQYGLQLNISAKGGLFRPILGSGCAVQIVNSEFKPQDLPLLRLKNIFGESPFSPSQASEQLNQSNSTIRRTLKRGLKEGLLVQAGEGSKTRYQFAG